MNKASNVTRGEREEKVTHHYGGRDLAACILTKQESSGISQETLHADDLAPFEELHIGGRQATEYLIERLTLMMLATKK